MHGSHVRVFVFNQGGCPFFRFAAAAKISARIAMPKANRLLDFRPRVGGKDSYKIISDGRSGLHAASARMTMLKNSSSLKGLIR